MKSATTTRARKRTRSSCATTPRPRHGPGAASNQASVIFMQVHSSHVSRDIGFIAKTFRGLIMRNWNHRSGILKTVPRLAGALVLAASLATVYACSSSASGETKNAEKADKAGKTGDAVIDIAAASAVEQPITRTLRGSGVKQGDLLIQMSAENTTAALDEAQANLARTAAGLGLKDGEPFDVEQV